MATGILSVGLHLIGYGVLSLIALAIGGCWWVLLAVTFAVTFFRDRAGWRTQARTPPALTAVAATTLLGTRLSLAGWPSTAAALLALAVLVWPVLLVDVARRAEHHVHGDIFLICVATQGIAVLGGRLSLADDSAWLGTAALVFFWLGLVLYVVALALFDVRQILTGAGDQWVAGGALAISALAGSTLLASPGGPVRATRRCAPPHWCSSRSRSPPGLPSCTERSPGRARRTTSAAGPRSSRWE